MILTTLANVRQKAPEAPGPGGAAARTSGAPALGQNASKAPGGQPKARVGSQLVAAKLLQAVNAAERPQVAYVPRSAIPRLQRQTCCDTLLGSYLVLLLGTLCGVITEARALKIIAEDPNVKKAASTAASAHETAIYKQVTSKAAYASQAAKSPASEDQLRKHVGEELLQAIVGKHRVLGRASAGTAAPGARPPAAAAAGAAAGEQQQQTQQRQQQQQQGPDAAAAGRKRKRAVEDEQEDLSGLFGSSSSGSSAESADAADAGGEVSSRPNGNTDAGPSATAAQSGHAHAQHDVEQKLNELFSSDEDEGDGDGDGQLLDAELQASSYAPAPSAGEDVLYEVDDDLAKEQQQQQQQEQQQVEGQQARAAQQQQEAQEIAVADSQAQQQQQDPPAGSQQQGESAPVQQPSALGEQPEAAEQQQQQQEPHDGQQPQQQGGEPSQSHEHKEKRSRSRPASDQVTSQVMEFVRGLLHPVYRAQLISKDQFKAVVRRAVDKIMERHIQDETAAFLLHEHEGIRRFVMRLVELERQRGSGSSS